MQKYMEIVDFVILKDKSLTIWSSVVKGTRYRITERAECNATDAVRLAQSLELSGKRTRGRDACASLLFYKHVKAAFMEVNV